MTELRDWRFWIVYEGRVKAIDENAAIVAARARVDEGLAPVIEVEPEGEE